ncbi:MAG: hypothetical protein LBD95_01865 [Clostridiales Family XIII bacterium]|jgi:hypothetical protein|nr:hypothetical protein [Clostridiales Family XIII bacterium]
MKKFLKALKVLACVVVALAVLVYGGVFLGHKVIFKGETSDVPTIPPAQNAEFTLGAQAHTQPVTMDEYTELLARQVKRHGEVAPALWPDNALTGKSLIIEALDGGALRIISPDGEIRDISKDELAERGVIRAQYFNGFSDFDGGAYVAASSEDLKNCLIWQKYLHLGSYDPFITFVHESFHTEEQPRWANADHLPNADARDEYLDDIHARAKRALLQRQLLAAVASPGEEAPILDALATYEDYKTQFPDDYKNSVYSDRMEGTAFYYELVACLYAAYPEQVTDRESLHRALALLATRDDVYVEYGLVTEGYHVGGFASVLLDRLSDDWQARLMADAETTPIEMLSRHFAGALLPAPRPVTEEDIRATEAAIAQKNESGGAVYLFKMLYNILF